MEYTAAERVALARRPGRPGTADYINALFTDFLSKKVTGCAAKMPAFWAALPCFMAVP